jgi:hypothetical protein
MLQSNLSGEKKSKHVINKARFYVDKYFSQRQATDSSLHCLRTAPFRQYSLSRAGLHF